MINTSTMDVDSPETEGSLDDGDDDLRMGEGEVSLHEYTEWLREMDEEPPWRIAADKEMDYADGKQLDTELLNAMKEQGIPPAIEDRIGPTLRALTGYEQTTRTDWRVTANGQTGSKDVADALNVELNEAERESHADNACSDAFRPQAAVGFGCVGVQRVSDPTQYRYKCAVVRRSEVRWDWTAEEWDLSDARYFKRDKWLHPERIARAFPQARELILSCGRNGATWWQQGYPGRLANQGGSSTGLTNAGQDARGWTVEEARWYDRTNKQLCLTELWYRRWVEVVLIESPDGRVVEYDAGNQVHNYGLATGMTKAFKAVVAKVRRSYWLGPHKLHDSPTPYPHSHFPYVIFWGFREDSTRVPYGYVRGLIYQQDSLNSGTALMRWGLSAYRVENTKGATQMPDAVLRRTIGRRNAHVVLDQEHMAKPGARFEVKRDVQLTEQQHQLMNDCRAVFEQLSAAPAAFTGQRGNATSGLQERTQLEQANQALGEIMGNFRRARTLMGEMLLSMIVQDLGAKEKTVIIEGDAVTEDRSVVLNKIETDPAGYTYLSNDVQRTLLKVQLEDVPSTPGYRSQQLYAMQEVIKTMPPQFQQAAMPYMVALMDTPYKREIIEALRAAGSQESPEQVEQRIQQEVQAALSKAGHDLKARELEMKERLTDAQIKKVMADAVQVGVQAAFSAMQGGAQVAMNPAIAPIADAIMQGAGYQKPNPGGDDPDFPVPGVAAGGPVPQSGGPAAAGDIGQVRENTSPAFPPIPQEPSRGMQGIETTAPDDNLPQGG